MIAYVLLNLLNELGNSDKMLGLSSMLSLLRKLNKFENVTPFFCLLKQIA